MSQASSSRMVRAVGSTSSSILSETKTWLLLLDKFLDATPIPSGVAGAAVELIKIAENVKKHREDCIDMARFVFQITEGILEATAGMKEDEMNAKLVEDLKIFQRQLESISTKLQLLTKRGTLSRIFRQDDMAVSINRYKLELRNQIDIFHLRHGISMQYVMTAQYAILKQYLENVENKVTNNTSNEDTNQITISSVLPPPPSNFYGRDQLIEKAADLILQHANAVLPARIPIMGAGGMGKTTLARAIAHSSKISALFGPHRYFISCDTVLTVQALIQEIMAVFYIPASSQDPLKDLLQFLPTMGPCLMILDNFETPWSVAEQQVNISAVLGHFNALVNLTLIITMRGKSRPDGVSWTTSEFVSLPPLDINAACAAFSAVACIKHTEESELQALMQSLDCVPLAIVLMAKLAQIGGSIADLLHQWSVDHTSMLADQIEDRLLNVEYSIQLSIESTRMKQCPEALQLLQIISMLPNGLHKSNLPDVAKNLGRMVTRAIYILQEVELVYQDRERVKVLSPIRAYIQSKHSPNAEDSDEVFSFYWNLAATFSRDLSETGDVSKLDKDLLHSEIGNLNYLLSNALREDLNESVIQVVHDFTYVLYWTTPSNEFLQILIDKGQWPCNPLLKAQCHQVYSDISCQTGQFANAINATSVARSIYDEQKQPLGIAQCLQALGDIAKVQNNYDTARAYFQQALHLFEQENGRLGYAQTLQSLAQIECVNGNFGNATALYEEALHQFKDAEDRIGCAHCLIGLGEVAQAQDEYITALETFSQAREEFLAIEHDQGATQCLLSLAATTAMQSKFSKAIDQLQEAQDKYQKYGNILGDMQCLHALGDIERVQGKISQARASLQTARIFFQHVGDQLATLRCLQSLGDLAIDQQEWELAKEFLNRARSQFEDMKHRLEVAQCIMSLGRVARKEQEYDKAQELLLNALNEFNSIAERRGAAECLRQLGLVYCSRELYEEAKRCSTQSLEIFRQIGCGIGIAEAIESLGNIAAMDSERRVEAEAFLSEALQAFEQMSIQRKAARCKQSLKELQNKMPGELIDVTQDTHTVLSYLSTLLIAFMTVYMSIA